MRKTLLALGMVAILLGACKKDDKNGSNNSKVDKCMYEIMSTYYLWNDMLPRYKSGENRDPEEFFYSLLYKDDVWSFCSNNADALNGELSGSPYSMGYSPQFWLYNDSQNVLIIVEYVYHNSPAERAGLKRGDIILLINGKSLTPDNYYDLYSAEQATLTLGVFDAATNVLDLTETTLTMSAELVTADPSYYSDVFDVNGRKVGYYVYTAFTGGTNNEYISTMDNVFDNFKSEGVKDLIIDLRYNGGGEQTAATHLASCIAPASVANENNLLIINKYNSIVDASLRNYYGSDYNKVYFESTQHNADIQNLYVLCTNGTASASELLAVGLMPYMNVTLIGENTYGKYTGMIEFDGSDKETEDLENWAIMPIVCKYTNSVGYTDFVDGLTPDYEVEDDLLNSYEFGDPDDPMIATALNIIGGNALTAKAAHIRPFKYLGRNKSIIGNNLIINNLKMPAMME